MREPDLTPILDATRIVATAAALDAVTWPKDAIVLRTAPDEVIVLATIDPALIGDAHAIVERESSLLGMWLDDASARALLERECDWEVPTTRPAFAQGAVAGVPVKLWLEGDQVLFIVAAPFAAEFLERCR